MHHDRIATSVIQLANFSASWAPVSLPRVSSNEPFTAVGESRKREDEAYYRRRALQEQVAAQRASCPAARDSHDELATMYRFRAAMLSTGPESWADAYWSDAIVEPA